MALTFKVPELIDLIDRLTTAHHDAQAKYKADCATARDRYEQKWQAGNSERVRELRDYLTKSLKAGKPPTDAEARRIMGPENRESYSSGISLFIQGGDGNVVKPPAAYYGIEGLEGLSALLQSHLEPTVTAHQLKELGIHPRDLERLFRVAVQAGVAVSK